MANIINAGHNFMSEYFTVKLSTKNKTIKINVLHIGAYVA